MFRLQETRRITRFRESGGTEVGFKIVFFHHPTLRMTTASPAIEARNLTKRFGDALAVDAADFDLRPGEVFGFLGPNGAGTTTTINMLTGLARPTVGMIRYFGRDVTRNVKKAQHMMGIVPDEGNL